MLISDFQTIGFVLVSFSIFLLPSIKLNQGRLTFPRKRKKYVLIILFLSIITKYGYTVVNILGPALESTGRLLSWSISSRISRSLVKISAAPLCSSRVPNILSYFTNISLFFSGWLKCCCKGLHVNRCCWSSSAGFSQSFIGQVFSPKYIEEKKF